MDHPAEIGLGLAQSIVGAPELVSMGLVLIPDQSELPTYRRDSRRSDPMAKLVGVDHSEPLFQKR